jgi:hypothetical protein
MVGSLVRFLALMIVSAGHHPATPPVVAGPGVDRPVEGYWQPGGYEGRIGSPYFYSVPAAGYRFAGYGEFGGCGCGGRHHSGWRRNASAGHYGGGYGWGVYDPYAYHFGPGYYRYAEHGHFRFPYYSYRRPWYHPGPPVFNRDTNFAW